MKPTVTIGVCVKNGEKMLRQAIDSIIAQDFPPEKVQVIFVDDGSTDNTPKIIASYLAVLRDHAKFFRGAWKGLGCARNTVVNNADGEYVLFVDADQVLTANYVRQQVEFMENNPRVGVTSGIFKTVPKNLMLNLEVAPFIVNQKNYLNPRSYIWKTDKLIGTGGTTFRLTAVKQAHGFNENMSGAGEDTDLVLRLKHTGWHICPNSAELYEMHGGLSKPKDLWNKYFWYGYGCHKNFQRTRETFSLPRMTPMAGLVAGVFYSFPAYKYLRQKQVFLLPFHFSLKLTAWTIGFIKGQIGK